MCRHVTVEAPSPETKIKPQTAIGFTSSWWLLLSDMLTPSLNPPPHQQARTAIDNEATHFLTLDGAYHLLLRDFVIAILPILETRSPVHKRSAVKDTN